jgi:hypothetical protein
MRSATAIGLAFGLVVSAALGCGSSGMSSAAAAPAPVTCSGATPVALTVKNYLSWCSVSVAGHAASSAGAQTVCVAAGTIALSATALAGFELGPAPWHHTDGDSGAGDAGTVTSGTSAASVTASGASTCAWICCPFVGGTGCPTTDQCP